MTEFPVPEDISATNPDAQVAWIAAEMDYSVQKANYSEKLVRLGREPVNPRSVFAIRASYWDRFRLFNQELPAQVSPETPAPVSQALQQYAKVVAGVCDKVAMTVWMDARNQETPEDDIDPNQTMTEALILIKRSLSQPGSGSKEYLLKFLDQPLAATPLGKAVLDLHEIYHYAPYNTFAMRVAAVRGSVAGLQLWQVYAEDLASRGFDVTLPKPGNSTNGILTWS